MSIRNTWFKDETFTYRRVHGAIQIVFTYLQVTKEKCGLYIGYRRTATIISIHPSLYLQLYFVDLTAQQIIKTIKKENNEDKS